MAEIRIKRLSSTAELPRYMSRAASGMDLSADLVGPILLEPSARVAVPTGLQVAIDEGYEGQVRPRSGLALHRGLTVVNSPGTIDADYRGEVTVLLINLGGLQVTIDPGMRIAQLVIAPVVRVNIEEVDDLEETTRGGGGFGSTGLTVRHQDASPERLSKEERGEIQAWYSGGGATQREFRRYEATVRDLEEVKERHLRLIAHMTTDSVTPEEAAEQRGQIAALIAEVGTLRSANRRSTKPCPTCGAEYDARHGKCPACPMDVQAMRVVDIGGRLEIRRLQEDGLYARLSYDELSTLITDSRTAGAGMNSDVRCTCEELLEQIGKFGRTLESSCEQHEWRLVNRLSPPATITEKPRPVTFRRRVWPFGGG